MFSYRIKSIFPSYRSRGRQKRTRPRGGPGQKRDGRMELTKERSSACAGGVNDRKDASSRILSQIQSCEMGEFSVWSVLEVSRVPEVGLGRKDEAVRGTGWCDA